MKRVLAPDKSENDFLNAYMAEILRWNSSMNLISRKDSEKVCFNLITQCRDAFRLFWSWFISEYGDSVGGPSLYADLGSGAGLPGVVWGQLFWGVGVCPESFLVEPREKRAWFLRRVARIDGSKPFSVMCSRWGEERGLLAAREEIGTAIISLKALHLKEVSVLNGLEGLLFPNMGSAAGLRRVVVARFYPAEQEPGQSLDASLGCPALGERVSVGGVPLVFDGCHIIGPTLGLLPASLVVTRYHRDAK